MSFLAWVFHTELNGLDIPKMKCLCSVDSTPPKPGILASQKITPFKQVLITMESFRS